METDKFYSNSELALDRMRGDVILQLLPKLKDSAAVHVSLALANLLRNTGKGRSKFAPDTVKHTIGLACATRDR